jgi:hypothetical protein
MAFNMVKQRPLAAWWTALLRIRAVSWPSDPWSSHELTSRPTFPDDELLMTRDCGSSENFDRIELAMN